MRSTRSFDSRRCLRYSLDQSLPYHMVSVDASHQGFLLHVCSVVRFDLFPVVRSQVASTPTTKTPNRVGVRETGRSPAGICSLTAYSSWTETAAPTWAAESLVCRSQKLAVCASATGNRMRAWAIFHPVRQGRDATSAWSSVSNVPNG